MRNPIAACLVACLFSACSANDDALVALGTLERDRLELTAEAHEPVLEVLVREGDRVAANQVLLRLDTASLAARLQSGEASVSAARHRLTELTRGPRLETILEARARLEGAVSALENESTEYERVRNLLASGVTTQSEVDRQRAARDRAQAARKEAEAQLTLLLKGTRIEELDQARDALTQAQGALDETRIIEARLTVRAPRAGTIEAIPYKLGERPPVGAPVVIMLADGETFARVYVPTALRSQTMSGTRAEIRVEGNERAYAGRVRYVAKEAAFTPYYALTQEDRGRLSYLAEVTLTDPDAANLPAGLPVEVTFTPATETARR
jgi:HlyD family secretion protein